MHAHISSLHFIGKKIAKEKKETKKKKKEKSHFVFF
jgi:hypothetical protein